MQVRCLLRMIGFLILTSLISQPTWSQTVTTGRIVGAICDENRNPLDFANVVVLGTTMGAMARNGGKFEIDHIPAGSYKLKVSFVGYEPRLRDVYVVANTTTEVAFCGEEPTAPKARRITTLPEPMTGELRIVDDGGRAVSSLPLQHTSIHASVTGSAAQVLVEQTFHNPFDHPIETVYVFPLPHRAAVNLMEVRIGDRVLRADIRKRQEAVQMYDVARREGRVAVLLEQERPNIFTQQITNIMPGHEILVRMRYYEQLLYDAGYELVVPTVVGPRFIPGKPLDAVMTPAMAPGQPSARGESAASSAQPESRRPGIGWARDTGQVPDASRITPHVLAPGADGGHRIDVTVDLDAGIPIDDITSINHAVDVQHDGKQRARIRLRSTDTIANKDFVLRYAVVDDRLRFGILAHREPDAQYGYFTLVAQPPARPKDFELAPLDLVLVLDVSGSMKGAPLETEKGVARWILQRLRPVDRFALLQFANHPSWLRMRQPVIAEQVQAALRDVEALRADGGTQMLPALAMAMGLPSDPERRRIICLMTDAYVGNEDELMRSVHNQLGKSRLFVIGIGSSPNRFLVDGLARDGIGATDFVSLDENPQRAVDRFFARIENPILEDIEIHWGRLEVQDVQPDPLPQLFFGRPLQITGRYRGSGRDDIVVRGRRGKEAFEHEVRVRLPGRETKYAELGTLWARRRIEDLAREARNGGLEAAREIERLGLEHSLMTRFTAFIATDNQVVNENGKSTLVPQPVEMPLGVRHEGIFAAGGRGLYRGVAGMSQTITVTGQAKASDVSHVRGGPALSSNASRMTGGRSDAGSSRSGERMVEGGRTRTIEVQADRPRVQVNDASVGSGHTPTDASPDAGSLRGSLAVSIDLVAERVARDATVQMRIVVENRTGRTLAVPERLTLGSGSVVISVAFSGSVLHAPAVLHTQRPKTVDLEHGATRKYVVTLNDVNGYAFTRPGTYEIRIVRVQGLPITDPTQSWTLVVN